MIKSKMIVHISRVIYREKHPYVRRFSSATKHIVEVDGKRTQFGVQFYKNYTKFIKAMKLKYGKEVTYNIDKNKPWVIYQ